MHEDLANATFRIECGGSSGSGFSFRDQRFVVTNFHVVTQFKTHPVTAIAEDGTKIPLHMISHSPENKFDFAIFEVKGALPANRRVLQPQQMAVIPRGTEVLFAGFPHGIPDLLVHEAIVSGPASPHGFYIDGSVNGGNSGGPIVAKATNRIVGIITQRRFLGAIQLGHLRQGVGQLTQHCQNIAGRGSVQIMGIDFGGFANMMAQGFVVLDQILQANANSGIGIGFRIDHVNKEYTKHGLP